MPLGRVLALLLLSQASLRMPTGPRLPWQPEGPKRARAAAIHWDFEALTPGLLPVSSSDLYTGFESEYVGSWWALTGAGAMQAGSARTLSPSGSPVAQTLAASGRDAGFAAQYTAAGGQYFEATAHTGPAGDFSVVWLGTVDTNATQAYWVTHANAGGTNWALGSNTVGRANWTPATGTTVQAAVSTVMRRGLHLYVGTYRRVGAGTSEALLYVDGVQVASTSAAALTDATSRVLRVGAPTTLTGQAGNHCFVGFTAKVLSPATVAAMAARAVPQTLYDARGVALTFARTSSATFLDSAARVGWAKPARPRLAGGGFLHEPPGTNLILHSEDLTAASWSAIGAPTRTANDAYASDGSKTATRLQLPAVGVAGDQRVSTLSNITVSNAASYTVSFFARATSGTTTLTYFLQNQTLGGTAEQYTTVPLTTAWTRHTKTFTTAGTAYLVCLGNTQVLTGQTSAAWDAEVWGVQLEAGSVATSPILTEGTAATRTVDDLRWTWATMSRAAFSAGGEARAEAFTLGVVGDQTVLGPEGADRLLAVYRNGLADRWGTFIPGNTTTAAGGAALLGAWTAGQTVWSQAQNLVTATKDGAFAGTSTWTDPLNGFTSTYVRLGNNSSGANPFNGILRNVRLRVVPP